MPDEIMFLAQGIEAAITSTNGIDPSTCVNLLDRNQNTRWLAGATATISIRIDMGADYYASAIGLLNNNSFTGGNAGNGSWDYWRVQSADDWAFTSNVVTRLSNVTPVAADEPIAYRDLGTPGSDRYWKIYIQSCLINVTKIGAIVLGTPYKSDLPYNRPRPMRSSYGIDVRETPGGHRHSNLRFEDRKIWRRADFDVLTEEDWDDLFQYLWQASKGGHYPCLFRDVDDSLNWIRVNAGRGTLDYQESLNHFFQAPFVFEQEF